MYGKRNDLSFLSHSHRSSRRENKKKQKFHDDWKICTRQEFSSYTCVYTSFFVPRNNYNLNNDFPPSVSRKEKQNGDRMERWMFATWQVDGEHKQSVWMDNESQYVLQDCWPPKEIWIESVQEGDGNLGEIVKVGNQPGYVLG